INRMGLSRSFQITNIFPNMSVFENVRCGVLWAMNCKYAFWQLINRRKDVKERTEHILEQIGMSEKWHIPASLLSY
ncbi:MAG: ABC transporter ATP-binding protein, partial [Anaerolineae bacterium]|nr:ABC transporter ATP-binding protein [Anaerolineae bacterium]